MDHNQLPAILTSALAVHAYSGALFTNIGAKVKGRRLRFLLAADVELLILCHHEQLPFAPDCWWGCCCCCCSTCTENTLARHTAIVRPQASNLSLSESADLGFLRLVLHGSFIPLSPCDSGSTEHICWQVLEEVTATFQEATSSLQSKSEPVNEAIVTILLDRCLTVLRQLRGITATYRMTARWALHQLLCTV